MSERASVILYTRQTVEVRSKLRDCANEQWVAIPQTLLRRFGIKI